MKWIRARLVRLLILLALLGVAGLNGLAWLQARTMLHYAAGGDRTRKPEELSFFRKAAVLLTGTRVPRPHSAKTPADFLLPFETLNLAGGPGGPRLGAWYCPVPTNSPILVLLFHGYAMDKASMLPEAAAFHALGIPSLLADFRGSGDSSASHVTIGFEESEDVAAVVRYARGRFPGVRLVLYGQSMGAAAILRAVARHDVKPEAVVLEAVFDTLLHTVENRFSAMNLPAFPAAPLLVFWGGLQFGFDGFDLSPLADARAVRCPALFLHGSGDPRARPAEADRVRAAVPGGAAMVIFPSTVHDDTAIRHPEDWRKTLLAFIGGAFPP